MDSLWQQMQNFGTISPKLHQLGKKGLLGTWDVNTTTGISGFKVIKRIMVAIKSQWIYKLCEFYTEQILKTVGIIRDFLL